MQDLDQLDDLLQYLGHSSPELLYNPALPLNSVPPWPGVEPSLEADIISSVINQRNLEQDQLSKLSGHVLRSAGKPVFPPEIDLNSDHVDSFQQARILFQQLGLREAINKNNLRGNFR